MMNGVKESEREATLADFDTVRAEHEALGPGKFNDDGIYKGNINQVQAPPTLLRLSNRVRTTPEERSLE